MTSLVSREAWREVTRDFPVHVHEQGRRRDARCLRNVSTEESTMEGFRTKVYNF